jgi:hypothetical protein
MTDIDLNIHTVLAPFGYNISNNDAVEKPFLQKYTQFFTAPISFHHTAVIFDLYQ